MIIYNITYMVPHPLVNSWQTWMIDIHLPAILQSDCFTKYQMVELLDTDETEGKTFAVQLYADNQEKTAIYLQMYAPDLRKAATIKWGNQILGFRTMMQIVHTQP